MEQYEYERTLVAAHLVANLVEAPDWSGAIAMADRAQSIGPIVDPTLYRSKGQALNEDL